MNILIDTRVIGKLAYAYSKQNISIPHNLHEDACRFCILAVNVYGSSKCSKYGDFVPFPSVSIKGIYIYQHRECNYAVKNEFFIAFSSY